MPARSGSYLGALLDTIHPFFLYFRLWRFIIVSFVVFLVRYDMVASDCCGFVRLRMIKGPSFVPIFSDRIQGTKQKWRGAVAREMR